MKLKNKIDTMIDSYMRYNTNLSMYFKILDKKTVLITLAEESVTTNNNFHLAFNAKDLQRIYKEELFDIAFNYSKEEIEEIISSRMETILISKIKILLENHISLENVILINSDKKILYNFGD